MPADDAIGNLAADLLAAVVARYAATGTGLPARRYTHAGAVAYDCEQVVVALETVYPGLPGAEQQSPMGFGAFTLTAQFAIHLVRCIPTPGNAGKAPSADALNLSGRELMLDAREVPKAITVAKTDGVSFSGCRLLMFVSVEPAEPAGGFGGCITRVAAQL